MLTFILHVYCFITIQTNTSCMNLGVAMVLFQLPWYSHEILKINLSNSFPLSTISIGLLRCNCSWPKPPIVSFCLLNECWRDGVVVDFTVNVKDEACVDNGWEVSEIDIHTMTETSESTFQSPKGTLDHHLSRRKSVPKKLFIDTAPSTNKFLH